MNADEVMQLINAPAGFGGAISLPTVQLMLETGRIRQFSPKSFITRRGQSAPRFCVVLRGQVRLTAFTEDGREMLTHIIRAGDCWGVHPCLGQFDETNDTITEDDAEVLMLTPETVGNLMWTRQDFQKALVVLLCRRLNLAVSLAEQFGSWSARERVAWRLLLLGNGVGGGGAADFIPEIAVSQETLASMVHLSRQRTNVILKALEKDGIIAQKYGRIEILSMDALRAQTDRAR